MERDPCDVTPKPHLLLGMRAERIHWHILLGEAVDNAFDVGAQTVAILIDDKKITIVDDGPGVTRETYFAMVTMGEHAPSSATELGRYGFGVKHQSFIAGNRFEVASVSKDGRLLVVVNWPKLMSSPRWRIDPPGWYPILAGTPTGTTITISDFVQKRKPLDAVDKIAAELADRYQPALKQGRTITLNGTPVPALADPPMTDVVEAEVKLSEGKSANVFAGLLTAPHPRNLVHVSYGFRVIKPRCMFGTGDYSGKQRMFARIELKGRWKLEKFKNDVVDEDYDTLEERVLEILRPILEKCHGATMSANLIERIARLNAMLPPKMQAARPKRVKPFKEPGLPRPPRPPRPPGETKNPETQQIGPARTRSAKKQLIIDFDRDSEPENRGLGYFAEGSTHSAPTVYLVTRNPWIGEYMKARDQRIGDMGLYQSAIDIYLSHQANGELPLGDFGLRAWLLLKEQIAQMAGAA